MRLAMGIGCQTKQLSTNYKILPKKPTQSRFEIEKEDRDGRSKKHGNKGGSDGS